MCGFNFTDIKGIRIPWGIEPMEDTRKLLGRRIKELRRRLNLTQEKLGDEAEMNYKYLGAIERGERNPSIENLDKIAVALKVKLHELFLFEHETESRKVINKKINEMLKGASEKEFGTIYRLIKAALK